MSKSIHSNLSSELNKELTKQCKAIGYKRSVVLGYLIDNPTIIRGICKDLLKSDNLVEMIERTTGIDMNGNNTVIPVDTDNSLAEVLKPYHITVSTLLYFIITNNVVYQLKDVLPNELKLKKFR